MKFWHGGSCSRGARIVKIVLQTVAMRYSGSVRGPLAVGFGRPSSRVLLPLLYSLVHSARPPWPGFLLGQSLCGTARLPSFGFFDDSHDFPRGVDWECFYFIILGEMMKNEGGNVGLREREQGK